MVVSKEKRNYSHKAFQILSESLRELFFYAKTQTVLQEERGGDFQIQIEERL